METGRGLRRLGFGTALATGLTLMGLSFSGMASLDNDLRAAAEQTPGIERVNVEFDEDAGRMVVEKGPCRREKRIRRGSDSTT
jgi:hypothetical protein